MKSGIYCIRNINNNKKYIGQSYILRERMYAFHSGCTALNAAIDKYGKENFEYGVILYCEIDDLDFYEIECIKIFHSHYTEWGYNISWGGNAPMRGRAFPEEGKIKLREALKGRISENSLRALLENRPDMHGEKSPLWGTHISDWHKSRIRESNTGPNSASFGKKSFAASSKYFGVSRRIRKYKKKNGAISKYLSWRVNFRSRGEHINVGMFKSELDAAHAYDKYIIEHGLPNPLNFPDEK